LAAVERWHLPSVQASGRRNPRVLFSRTEARGVLIDLQAGEELGDHRVRESALVYVVSGRVRVESEGSSCECEAGSLLLFPAGETRRVTAESDGRILLLLAPWPGAGHYTDDERVDPERMPADAAEPPITA
jgi:quercetin dioxygenase-like cupin family protein